MGNGKGCQTGCGCLVMVAVAIVSVVGGCEYFPKAFQEAKEKFAERKASRARQDTEDVHTQEYETVAEEEKQRKEKVEREKKIEETKRLEQDKEERLRMFALKEAQSLWQAYQDVQAIWSDQSKRVKRLKESLVEFDQDPETDADYKRLCHVCDEMRKTLNVLHVKIEDAYIAQKKFEATPGRKEYEELRRKLIEDGVREAEAATKRYKELSLSK